MDMFPLIWAIRTPTVCYTEYTAERPWKSIVEDVSEQQPLRLSVIVLAYKMTREIPRTLCSLSRTYQEGAADLDYEVILIDNGSPTPLDPARWAHLDVPVQSLRIEEAHPSPAQALNFAASQAQGEWLCIMIDGAHLLTPGVFSLALAAGGAFTDAAIAVRYFFLGPDEQNISIQNGYCQSVEDQLLKSICWPDEGYRLFEVGTPFRAGAGSANWLHKMFESNCLFISRHTFQEIGGAEEQFDLPGGGFLNLDLYKRACDRDGVTPVQLIGEGSFHQLHGGTTTNVPMQVRQERSVQYREQYRQIRGHDSYTTDKSVFYFGHMPTERSRIHRYHKG